MHIGTFCDTGMALHFFFLQMLEQMNRQTKKAHSSSIADPEDM